MDKQFAHSDTLFSLKSIYKCHYARDHDYLGHGLGFKNDKSPLTGFYTIDSCSQYCVSFHDLPHSNLYCFLVVWACNFWNLVRDHLKWQYPLAFINRFQWTRYQNVGKSPPLDLFLPGGYDFQVPEATVRKLDLSN